MLYIIVSTPIRASELLIQAIRPEKVGLGTDGGHVMTAPSTILQVNYVKHYHVHLFKQPILSSTTISTTHQKVEGVNGASATMTTMLPPSQKQQQQQQ